MSDTAADPGAAPRGGGGAAGPQAVWPVPGYLDAASGEPLHPMARQALLQAVDAGWADPARLYREARRARLLLDAARAAVAGVLGARPDEVAFTSSGTAAVHAGVLGTLLGRARVSDRLVVSAVEHSCVLRAADRHAAAGGRLEIVGVDATGAVDPAAYVAACARPEPAALAALQVGNHEVGTLQPVDAVAADLALLGVPLLVDAAAAVGRVALPTRWDVLAASAHKWGGPAGVGVLAVRTGVRWRSPYPDDERESGRVPGFPAVPLAVAAAAALEAVARDREREAVRLAALVDRIRAAVPATVPDVEVVGDPVRRLPHVVTFSCLYVDGETLVGELDRLGLAVSSGSACASDTRRPSHVLAAMGALTQGNVRVSLPFGAAEADVDRLLAELPAAVARARAALPA